MILRVFTYLMLAVCLCAAAVYAVGLLRSATSQAPADAELDKQALVPFSREQAVSRQDYERLAFYFQTGFELNRDELGSTAHYEGLPSNHRKLADRIEGFTRIAPLLAVLLESEGPGRPNEPTHMTNARQSLIQGLTNGSDPSSAGYWGPISDNDQLIVEASDVALTLWLLRDSVWIQLTPKVKQQLINWLLQVNHKRVPDNNWHLFITYINLVIRQLGYPADMNEAKMHYARFREFYKGDGWFSDGPDGRFDYYNAWGIHYQLFWIDQADETYDHVFITSALDEFAQHLKYLIGPSGIPIMGRSICYRMAVAAPLILDQELAHPSVPSGIARRALRVTWSYFIKNDGVKDGNITQGYCAADHRVLDSYSGPASCLWGLRSLISALYLPSSSRLWREGEQALPVEEADYTIRFTEPGWTVRGTRPSVIVIEKASGNRPVPLQVENRALAILDQITHRVHRPANEESKYGLAQYHSDLPFCGCAAAHEQ